MLRLTPVGLERSENRGTSVCTRFNVSLTSSQGCLQEKREEGKRLYKYHEVHHSQRAHERDLHLNAGDDNEEQKITGILQFHLPGIQKCHFWVHSQVMMALPSIYNQTRHLSLMIFWRKRQFCGKLPREMGETRRNPSYYTFCLVQLVSQEVLWLESSVSAVPAKQRSQSPLQMVTVFYPVWQGPK